MALHPDQTAVNRDEIEVTYLCLFNDFKPAVTKFCIYRLQTMPDKVENCVQDTFEALHKHLLNGNEVPYPKAWLYLTANNIAKVKYKNLKFGEYYNVDDEGTGDPFFFRMTFRPRKYLFDKEEIAEHRDTLLAALEPADLTLLADLCEPDLTLKDLSQKYKVPTALIQQQGFRIRKKLKDAAEEIVGKKIG